MRKLLSILAVSVLVLTACSDDKGGGGGGNLSAADQEYVDAAMETFDPEEAAPLTEDDGRCIVESMVGVVGADGLKELGIDPESFGGDGSPFPEGLSEEDANDIVDGMDGCVDLSGLFLDAMAADASITDESRDCLADTFDKDFIHLLLVALLTGGEDALGQDSEITTELLAAFQECGGLNGG
jgi:hypothetical protein